MRLSACKIGMMVALSVLVGCSSSDKEAPKGKRESLLANTQTLSPNVTQEAPEIPAAAMNVDWNQAGGLAFKDIGNLAGHLSWKEPFWEQDIGDTATGTYNAIAQPIIMADTVFVMNAEAEIYAIKAKNGDILWQKSLIPDSEEDVNPRGGGLAAEDGIVYATTGTGLIYALRADNGKKIWQIDNRIPFSSPPTLSDGVLYVIDRDNRLQAINARAGKPLWDYRSLPQTAVDSRPASASVLGNVVIAPFTSGEVVALNAKNAQAAWGKNLVAGNNFSMAGQFHTISSFPVITDQKIFVGTSQERFVALQGSNGQSVWELPISVSVTPLSAGNSLYVVSNESEFFALRKADGGIFYKVKLPRYIDGDKEDLRLWSAPVMLEGNIMLVAQDGLMVTIDPQTGKILSKKQVPETYHSPVVAYGKAYILDNDGTLYAYR